MQALENDVQDNQAGPGAEEGADLEAGQGQEQDANLEEGAQSSEGEGEGEQGEGEGEKPITYSEEQQTHMNGIIGTKVAQTHEQRQRADNLQLQVNELQKQIPVAQRPTVPDLPDPLSVSNEEFAIKVTERDTALLAQQTFDSNERFQCETALQNAQNEQVEMAKQVTEKLNDYDSRSVKLGIKPEELSAAGQTIANHGLNLQTQGFILDQATGPQITLYLAKNPQVLSDLALMSPMDAAVKISTEIKGLAAGVVKQTNLLDDPAESLSGQGSQEGARGPRGATFE